MAPLRGRTIAQYQLEIFIRVVPSYITDVRTRIMAAWCISADLRIWLLLGGAILFLDTQEPARITAVGRALCSIPLTI